MWPRLRLYVNRSSDSLMRSMRSWQVERAHPNSLMYFIELRVKSLHDYGGFVATNDWAAAATMLRVVSI